MANTITEFLTSIGYALDEKSTSDFRKSLENVEKVAVKVAAAFAVSAAALAKLFTSMTTVLDELYFSAQRSQTSAENLQAFVFALRQTGMSGSRAIGAVASFSSALLLFPGMESSLNAIGVQTREGGRLRDRTDLLLDTVRKMKEGQNYIVGSKIMEKFGVGEKDFFHLTRNLDQIQEQIDQQKRDAKDYGANGAAQSSMLLMRNFAALKMTLSLLIDYAVVKIAPKLMPVINRVDEWLKANKEFLVQAITAFVGGLIWLMSIFGDWLTWLFKIGAKFDKLTRSILGQGGLVVALELFSAGVIANLALRAGKINKLIGLGVLAMLGAFAVRDHLSGSAGTAPPAQRPSAQPASFAQRVTNGAMGIVNRVRRVFGLDPFGPNKANAPSGPPLDRSTFDEELKDPRVRQRLLAYVEAEVGSQGADAQQAFMESVFNRAKARGKSLWETLQGSYFPPETHSRAAGMMGSPSLDAKYKSIFDAVKAGSNITDFATGNASNGVGFNSGQRTRTFGGEDFGIEGPDLGWAKRARQRALQTPVAPMYWKPPADKPDWSRPAPLQSSGLMSTPWDEDSTVTATRTTRIVYKGDTDPHKTAQAVAREQHRINTDMIATAAVA